MKLEQGIVVETEGKVAKIKVGRHSDCTNCGGCPGSNSIIVTANNPVQAVTGQRVEFEVKETHVLVGAFTVFIWPLLAAAAGIAAGHVVAGYSSWDGNLCRMVGGVLFFVVSLAFVRIFDRSAAGNDRARPDILRIL